MDRSDPTPSVLVDVALPLPLEQNFTYALPPGVEVPVGTRVLVPFRRTLRVGWVVAKQSGAPPKGLRSVQEVLDPEGPSVAPALMGLARWIGDYYFAPLGLVLRAALPALLSDHSRDQVRTVAGRTAPADLSRRQHTLWLALRSAAGPRSIAALGKELGLGSVWPEVRALMARGLAEHVVVAPKQPKARTRKVIRIVEWLDTLAERDTLLSRAPKQRETYQRLEAAGGAIDLAALDREGLAGAARALVKRGVAEVIDEVRDRDPFSQDSQQESAPLQPTPDQSSVLEELLTALAGGETKPFLLHGITGSGKTLVYIELLEVARAQGKGAIVLVPEIGLTPQTVSRFRARFGDDVAVLHSGLSDGERFDAWRAVREGRKRIVVGARSAVFAPVADLGVIVVDEEHDGSYKQSETPRYHGRDLAVMRARLEGAVCVLGSATPSLESWTNAQQGKYRLLSLPARVSGGALPPVRVVDLRAARSEARASQQKSKEVARGEGGLVLSAPLIESVHARLSRKEQSILLLNRRGYSSFLQCQECGYVIECGDCSVSMTFHRGRGLVVCHHCGRDEPAPPRCPKCGEDALSYRGIGTEQVERVVAQTFPGARIARMDMDTTGRKWAHHSILDRVARGEVDILLGTQMIAKGLDFPNVTLVGVINADVGLHLPDFRASERTFQLLSQVAGRAGRGPRGGEVWVQTALPEHYVIERAVVHDFPGFAELELKERKAVGYPPYVRAINVVVSSPDQALAARHCQDLARHVLTRLQRSDLASVRLTGPAPSPIERLHTRWRWHFVLKGPARALGLIGGELRNRQADGGDVRVVLDRDPVAVL